jgi:MFS family permease
VLFLNYVDRGALPTAANLVQADLHLTATQLGWLFSAFFCTYTVLQIPVGWLAERYGAARVLAAGLALWALATMLVGFAYSFVTLLVLRLILGCGESVGFPATSKILAATVPAHCLGTANGVIAFAYLLGPAVGVYCGGMLIEHAGWRHMFMIFGAISLLWLLPWMRVGIRRESTLPPAAPGPAFGELLRQRAMWATGLGHLANNYTYYFMLSWLPLYLVKERGFSQLEMAQLAGSAYLINAICAMLAGWAIDRYIARGGTANLGYKVVMSVSQFGTVVCMLGMTVGTQPWVLASMFVYQVLCGVSSPGVFAVSQIFAGPAVAGRWVGVQNTMGNVAGIVAPALTGLVVQVTGHFAGAFILAAAVGLMGTACWALLMPPLGEISWTTTRVRSQVVPR